MSSKSRFTFLLLFSLWAMLNGLFSQTQSIKYDWAIGMGSDDASNPLTVPPGPPDMPERGQSIAVDKVGNIYVTGQFIDTVDFDPSSGVASLYSYSNDIFFAKYDPSGSLVWVRQITGYNNQRSTKILVDDNNQIFLTGGFIGKVDFDPSSDTAYLFHESVWESASFISKYDTDGNYLWAGKIGGIASLIFITDAELTKQGELLIAGDFYRHIDFDPSPDSMIISSSEGRWESFIARYKADGTMVWAERFRSVTEANTSVTISDVATDTSGNIYVTGRFWGTVDFNPIESEDHLFSSATACFVVRLDEGGIFISAFKLDGRINPGAIIVGKNGSLTIGGSFDGSVDYDPSPDTTALNSEFQSLFLANYSGNDGFRWVKQISSQSADLNGMASGPEGKIVIIGELRGMGDFDPSETHRILTASYFSDDFIASYDSLGNYLNAKILGSEISNEYINALAVDLAGNVFITGSFDVKVDFDLGAGISNISSNGFSDIFIAKYATCDRILFPDTIDVVECNSFTLPGGTVLSESGIYLDELTGVSGCDSTIVFNLKLNHTYSTIVVEDCRSYTAPDGVVHTYSGVKTAILTNAVGCDSIIIIYLTIKNTSRYLSVSACNNYLGPDGIVYTTSGLITIVIPNAAGCDSTIRIDLTIHWLNTSMVYYGSSSLKAIESDASYRWLDCNNLYLTIEGDTGQMFTSSFGGSFAVEITKNGCSDTSTCRVITVTGLSGNISDAQGLIFPNPANTEVSIDFGRQVKSVQIQLFDLPGKLILSRQATNTNKLRLDLPVAAGIYFVVLNDGTRRQTFKVLKQ